MISWFSSEKRRAREMQEKAEHDARLRAELAVKARQFDADNKHRFEAVSEISVIEDSTASAVAEAKRKYGSGSSVTVHDFSARTSFNF